MNKRIVNNYWPHNGFEYGVFDRIIMKKVELFQWMIKVDKEKFIDIYLREVPLARKKVLKFKGKQYVFLFEDLGRSIYEYVGEALSFLNGGDSILFEAPQITGLHTHYHKVDFVRFPIIEHCWGRFYRVVKLGEVLECDYSNDPFVSRQIKGLGKTSQLISLQAKRINSFCKSSIEMDDLLHDMKEAISEVIYEQEYLQKPKYRNRNFPRNKV